MQTLGLLKEFAVRGLHESPLDTKLASLLVPRWTMQSVHRINTFTQWRWNEDQTTLTWPATGILYLPEWIEYPLAPWPSESDSYLGIVDVMDAAQFDRGRPNYTRDGKIRLVVFGDYNVELDNPTAGQLLVTGAVADEGMVVLIEGLSAAGRALKELVTIPAAGFILSANAYAGGVGGVRRIVIITAADAAVAPAWGAGEIVITSGGVMIETLNSVYENAHHHKRTELYNGSGEFPTRYYRRHAPLYRDTDVIEVPSEFEEIVELGIQIKLSIFKEHPAKAGVLNKQFDTRLRELLAWDKRQPARSFTPRFATR